MTGCNYTVVLGSYNEAGRIELVLRNFYKHAPIIVVDNFSTDDTVNIAKKYTSQVYQYKNPGSHDRGYFEFAISKVKTDWVLFASASEVIPNGILDVYSKVSSGITKYKAVSTWRKSISCGRWTHRNRRHKKLKYKSARFGHKSAFDFSRYRIHGETQLKIPPSEVLLLPADDEHVLWQFRDYDTKWTEHKHSIYADIEAKQCFERGERTSVLKIVLLSLKEFLSSYFRDGGLPAGAVGFFTAVWRAQMKFNIQTRIWEYQNDLTLKDIKQLHAKMKEEMIVEIEENVRDNQHEIYGSDNGQQPKLSATSATK